MTLKQVTLVTVIGISISILLHFGWLPGVTRHPHIDSISSFVASLTLQGVLLYYFVYLYRRS